MLHFTVRYTALLFWVACLTACMVKNVPEEALALKPESLQQRQMQTRRFETADEAHILAACASLLQDIGFSIDETEIKLGVLTASKHRSAQDGKQIAAAVVLLVLLGVQIPLDTSQTMTASVITRPIGEDRKYYAVRVTFQRVVLDDRGRISKRESLTDPRMYQGFFEKLSKALFLEAHEI
jgi:hypothetical protein